MQTRQLGRSGMQVSVVGLGCNNFGGRLDLERSRAVVHRALDAGITLFDTADVYGNRGGSEEILGAVLSGRRDQVVLATKFGIPMSDDGGRQGASRRYILRAVEASLKRLRTDYIDLYQLHRPDPHTPIEETLSALDDLVRRGMVRYVGCSNLKAWQVVDAHWTARARHLEPFVSAQDEYSLLVRDAEQELLPALQHLGMGLLPYFPLASGLLSGKYHHDAPLPDGARITGNERLKGQLITADNWRIVEELRVYAQERGFTLLELAMSWLARHPSVSSVIAGATSAEQVEQNARATRWVLTTEELTAIGAILNGERAAAD